MVKFPHVLACVGECSGPTFFHLQHIMEVFLHDHNEAKVRECLSCHCVKCFKPVGLTLTMPNEVLNIIPFN